MCLDAGRHVHGMAHRVSLSDLRKSENLFVLSLEAVGGWVGWATPRAQLRIE